MATTNKQTRDFLSSSSERIDALHEKGLENLTADEQVELAELTSPVLFQAAGKEMAEKLSHLTKDLETRAVVKANAKEFGNKENYLKEVTSTKQAIQNVLTRANNSDEITAEDIELLNDIRLEMADMYACHDENSAISQNLYDAQNMSISVDTMLALSSKNAAPEQVQAQETTLEEPALEKEAAEQEMPTHTPAQEMKAEYERQKEHFERAGINVRMKEGLAEEIEAKTKEQIGVYEKNFVNVKLKPEVEAMLNKENKTEVVQEVHTAKTEVEVTPEATVEETVAPVAEQEEKHPLKKLVDERINNFIKEDEKLTKLQKEIKESNKTLAEKEKELEKATKEYEFLESPENKQKLDELKKECEDLQITISEKDAEFSEELPSVEITAEDLELLEKTEKNNRPINAMIDELNDEKIKFSLDDSARYEHINESMNAVTKTDDEIVRHIEEVSNEDRKFHRDTVHARQADIMAKAPQINTTRITPENSNNLDELKELYANAEELNMDELGLTDEAFKMEKFNNLLMHKEMAGESYELPQDIQNRLNVHNANKAENYGLSSKLDQFNLDQIPVSELQETLDAEIEATTATQENSRFAKLKGFASSFTDKLKAKFAKEEPVVTAEKVAPVVSVEGINAEQLDDFDKIITEQDAQLALDGVAIPEEAMEMRAEVAQDLEASRQEPTLSLDDDDDMLGGRQLRA